MEDAQIVQLYWDRDERAIPATAEKYGSYCLKLAQGIVGDAEDAKECVNDAYWNAWNAMPPHRPEALSAFLAKLVRRVAFNRYQHDRAEKRGGGELPAVLDELAECVSGREDVERAFDARELAAAIDGFLETLPREKRTLFLRRYFYAESVSGLARRSGRTEGAVSMTLLRLRQKLRAYLLERGYEV